MAPIFGSAEGGDDPFRAVGDQQRDAVASPDPDGEQRPGEVIRPRLETGVIETLVAKNHSLGASGAAAAISSTQVAQGSADRARARVGHS